MTSFQYKTVEGDVTSNIPKNKKKKSPFSSPLKKKDGKFKYTCFSSRKSKSKDNSKCSSPNNIYESNNRSERKRSLSLGDIQAELAALDFDSDLDQDQEESLCESPLLLQPPKPLMNTSPYECQLLKKLVPRHITVEYVVFSHKIKVGGRSLYFFSPAFRGSLSKPVFTTREKVNSLLITDEESDSGSWRRRKKEDSIASGVCSLKRIHLLDPACDLGVSVWRGRGPQKGARGHQVPHSGRGPALLVEAFDIRNGETRIDGMAVAVGFIGQIMYLVPIEEVSKTDSEPRTTEIFVEDAMLTCVCESVVWYTVKTFSRRKNVTPRQSNFSKLGRVKSNLAKKDSSC